MSDVSFLRDLVLIFAVAVSVVAVLRRVGVPSIAGFVAVGILLGPRSLGVVADTNEVKMLAEIGVAFLLFGIGLELSLERIRRLWRRVLIGGTLQIGLTLWIAFGVASLLGCEFGTSVLVGCLIALSSTAIVLRGLETRGDLDAPHGRFTVGILLLQDLSVVPMMLAIPLLGGHSVSASGALLALLKAASVLAGVLFASRLVVPKVLHLITRTRQRDLFVLSVFLLCLGTAWIVSRAGISLAIGAFLAGLVVAGSQYRHQALSDLIPFRDVFTSFFFVSMGMLLDPAILVRNAWPVLGLFAAILFAKFIVVFLVGLLLRLPLRVCVLAGMALAQVGEFSFVLAREGERFGLFQGALAANLTAAIILTMLVTPLLLSLGPRVAAGLGKSRVLTRLLSIQAAAELPEVYRSLEGHVIIAGYGVAGEDLASALRACGIPYLVVDIGSENVRRALGKGEPAFFGDVTSPRVLELMGIEAAREFVLLVNDPDAIERATRAARSISPRVPILVRTRYVLDEADLMKAGATEVIVAEVESSLEMTSRVLSRHNVEASHLSEQLTRIRNLRLNSGPERSATRAKSENV